MRLPDSEGDAQCCSSAGRSWVVAVGQARTKAELQSSCPWYRLDEPGQEKRTELASRGPPSRNGAMDKQLRPQRGEGG